MKKILVLLTLLLGVLCFGERVKKEVELEEGLAYEEYNLVNGKKEGYGVTYLKEDGFVILEGYYKNDKKEGIFKDYDSMMDKIAFVNYENDERNGKYIGYSRETGKLEEETDYVDGLYDGKMIIYNEDGTVFMDLSYKKGFPHGLWILNDEKGRKQKVENYKDGYPEGEWLYYNKIGDLVKKEYYKKGKLVKKY